MIWAAGVASVLLPQRGSGCRSPWARVLRCLFIALAALRLMAMPAQAADAVTLQLKWTHGFQFAGYYAALAQGYYRDAGLDVHIAELQQGMNTVNQVVSGQANFGIGSSSLLVARASGKPVVALAAIFQHSPLVLVSRNDLRTTSDLIGKKVMIEPLADELLAYLAQSGVPREKLTLVPHTFNVRSLVGGDVDAMSVYLSDEIDALNKAKFNYQVHSPVSAGIGFYADVLFTSERELQNYPGRVERFRAASLRGWEYAMTHPDEIIDLILERYAVGTTREHLVFEANALKALIRPDLIEIGHMNPVRWQGIASLYAKSGVLPENFSLDGFIYEPNDDSSLGGLYYLLGVSFIALSVSGGIALYIYKINRRLTSSVADLEGVRQALEQETKKLQASEERLTAYAEELSLQNSVLKLLQDAVALPEVLRSLAQSVEARHRGMLCSILTFSETDRALYLGAAPSLPEFFTTALHGLSVDEGVGCCGTAAARDQMVIVENIQQDPLWGHYREIAARAGLQACWSQPIHSSDQKLIGTFAIYHRRPAYPTDADRALIRHFSWLAGIAIEKSRSTERMRLSEEQLRFVLEAAELGYWDWDIKAGTVARNERWATMLGYTLAEIGQPSFRPTFLVHPDDVDMVQRSIDDVLAGRSAALQIAYRMLHKDGSVRWILDHSNVTQRDAHGRPARMCGTHIDITERKLAEERALQLAFYDPLTGLPNRRLLSDRLRQTLASNARHPRFGALMLLDLDNFKPLNDRYGHAAGDQLLVELARRLTSRIRAEDTAARLGGDEFVVVINELGDSEEQARRQAMAVAEKIRNTLNEPYCLRVGTPGQEQPIEHRCSTSIGLTLFFGGGGEETTLIHHADLAMYLAKQAGKNAIRIYDEQALPAANMSRFTG
jgi:diguanylate cyclase (GGDEF)-like protein/PAS domain S-box-containing protein